MDEKWAAQERQYAFPYHYLPQVHSERHVSLAKGMAWGLEYLCYQQHVIRKVEALTPGALLDIGCGDGRMLFELERRLPGSSTLHGQDLAKPAIALAKAMLNRATVSDKPLDTIDGAYDVLTAVQVLEHVPDEEVSEFLRSIARLLTPGGHAIVSVPHKNKPLIEKHFRHYDAELFHQQLAQSGVTALRVESIEPICDMTLGLRLLRKLSHNRYWTLDVPRLNAIFWNRLTAGDMIAPDHRAQHLTITLAKD